MAAGAAAGAGLIAGGPVAALVAGAYAAVLARGLRRRHTSRLHSRERTEALDALCALAADLRAGLPPAAAGPVTGHSGWRAPQARRLVELAAAATGLAEATGAPLADLVERIESDARAVDRAATAAAAQAAGARATAWLLAALPLGGIALGYGIGVDPLHVLLRTPVGVACATAAVLLQLGGLAWADRLARTPFTPGSAR
jgi:tight adherence protein B